METPARRTYREGPIGALMDEFERAVAEFARLVGEISEEGLRAVCRPEGEEFRSIQAVVHHVVRAGYGHADHLRLALGVEGSHVEVPLGDRAESLEQLAAVVAYLAATLEGRWRMSEDDMSAVEFRSAWGVTYDLEQMLEHAIVHVLRHRRQIERFLGESRSGGSGAAERPPALER